jgi:antirestriction protein
MSTTNSPAIYVACLASYNDGILHGKWINDLSDKRAIWTEIKEILASSPIEGAEEWAIHNYEGFGNIEICEYSSIDFIHQASDLICEHGEELISELYSNLACLDTCKTALDEDYTGCYDTLEDYAEQYMQECYGLPNNIAFYIDYKRFARDLEIDLLVINLGYEVHLFYYR